MAPVHPGNGMLHWGSRVEVPRATEWEENWVAVPVTLLRGNSDLTVDRLRQVIIGRGTRTTRFRFRDLRQLRVPGAPEGAEWTAWVTAEARN